MEHKYCIDAAELGKRLGIGRAHAYELVHRDDFPKIALGRRYLIPVAEIERWLKEQSAKGSGEHAE